MIIGIPWTSVVVTVVVEAVDTLVAEEVRILSLIAFLGGSVVPHSLAR
jgi:hypothetical protein